VEALMPHNRMGIHGLLQGELYFFYDAYLNTETPLQKHDLNKHCIFFHALQNPEVGVSSVTKLKNSCDHHAVITHCKK
jgi:hypothetical protein